MRAEDCPWHKSHKELPKDGQKVYYFGPQIGLWRGTYRHCPEDKYNPHLFFSDADPVFGINMHVDRDDAPFWREYSEEYEKKGYVPLPPYEYLRLDLLG